jgi:hypothetical protein
LDSIAAEYKRKNSSKIQPKNDSRIKTFLMQAKLILPEETVKEISRSMTTPEETISDKNDGSKFSLKWAESMLSEFDEISNERIGVTKRASKPDQSSLYSGYEKRHIITLINQCANSGVASQNIHEVDIESLVKAKIAEKLLEETLNVSTR